MKQIFFALLFLTFAAKGQIVETIVGNGVAGYTGDNGLAINAELNQPTNVKFDSLGNMYITDWINNVIRKVDLEGIITTVVGNGYGAGTLSGGFAGDNGSAINAELSGPSDIAFDKTGNMYISDNSNAVIRKVNTLGIITTIAGTGVFGYNGDGIQAINAELNFTLGIVLDNAGNLYFSDEGNSRVRKIDTAGIITTIAGTGVYGYSGDNGPAISADLRRPCVLTISPSGDIYIPDLADHRVRKVNDSGIISTVAGNGTPDVTGDYGPATSAGISGCQAVAFDDSNNLILSNNVNCSIRKVSAAGIITTIAGNDTCGYSGDGGIATAAKINYSAYCTAKDMYGNLYFADSKNNVIRRIVYTPTKMYTAVNNVDNTGNSVFISPNPAYNNITISSAGTLEKVDIVNTIGQVVLKQSYSSNIQRVDIAVEYLPKGVYFVKINDGIVKKLVKE